MSLSTAEQTLEDIDHRFGLISGLPVVDRDFKCIRVISTKPLMGYVIHELIADGYLLISTLFYHWDLRPHKPKLKSLLFAIYVGSQQLRWKNDGPLFISCQDTRILFLIQNIHKIGWWFSYLKLCFFHWTGMVTRTDISQTLEALDAAWSRTILISQTAMYINKQNVDVWLNVIDRENFVYSCIFCNEKHQHAFWSTWTEYWKWTMVIKLKVKSLLPEC